MDKLQNYFDIINATWKLLKKFLTMERPEFGSDEYWSALVMEAAEMGEKYGTGFSRKQACAVIEEIERIWREQRNG